MIKGKKVSLRPIKKTDFDLIIKWINHPKILPFWHGRSDIKTKEWVKQHYSKIIKEEDASLCFIIEFKNKPIGFMYNTPVVNDGIFSGAIELDILIGDHQLWNQGLGQDALKTMINFAFSKQNAERVFLIPREHNLRAIHVYQKICQKKFSFSRSPPLSFRSLTTTSSFCAR